MLSKLKKNIIAILNFVEGVKAPSHLLTDSDLNQMRRIMIR